ncbi:MAG TPA: putative hydro-lyase [Streptosporangiaceae bacterium]
MASLDRPPALPPELARARFRTGAAAPTTSGWCTGFAQANLLAVPRDLAFDALLFARRNPRPCPLLDVTDPGDPVPREVAPGADLRTDLPGYRVYEGGELTAEVADATPYWREDMVAFLYGCSFTFEGALLAAGVPVRHLEQDRNVPMYVTTRPCAPAGRLAGPLVVSMRPVPDALVERAVEVTAGYPTMHGAPVHVGDPAGLGIADLTEPDFGDAVEMAPGDVPVFWACGVTPQAVVMASRPPYAITHAPGRMFITDRTDISFSSFHAFHTE